MKNPEPKQIWILGAGKFGGKAVDALVRDKTNVSVTVIDRDPERLDLPKVNSVCSDAVDWLLAHFSAGSPAAGVIIPAIPIHVAAEWLRRALQERGIRVSPADLPESYVRSLPNPIKVGSSKAFASFAEVMCPESCDEPEGYCYLTGNKRETNLYDLLKNEEGPDFTSLVVRSYQLAAGVGECIPPISCISLNLPSKSKKA